MTTIQKVDPRDADVLSIIAYAAKASWGYPAEWMAEWRDVLVFSPEYFEINESWSAMADKKPVAFYTLQEKQAIAWIENLWVLPEYIGSGIGKSLFLHAADVARKRGFGALQLESDPNAAGFYEKMGMRKVGERRADMEGQPRSLPLMEMSL